MKFRDLLLVVAALAMVAHLSVKAIFPRTATFKGHSGAISFVAASLDGKTIASMSNDDCTIRLWDVATRKERAILEGYACNVTPVNYGPGKKLSSGGSAPLAFSPDGKILASAGGRDRMVYLWEADTGKQRAILRGHTGEVRSVAFSPDSRILASGSEDRTVRLWDVATGKERRRFSGSSGYCTPAFSPDGETLAFAGSGETIMLGDITQGKERQIHRGQPHPSLVRDRDFRLKRLAFSPDGRTLASNRCWGGAITLWDVTTGKDRGLHCPDWLCVPEEIEYLAFSPDGKTVASGSRHKIGLWDVASRGNTVTFQREGVRSVFFARDGDLVGLGSNGRTVMLWLDSGKWPLFRENE